MDNNNMTGAELQTMREACHLSRDDLAGLVGVQARTVKHWEHGRAGVPGDVAGVVRNIDQQVTDAARYAVGKLLAMQAAPARVLVGQAAKMVLMRYRNAADMARHNPSIAGLPDGVQGCIVARIMQALAMASPDGAGAPGSAPVVRVVWFNPDEFEAWRAAHKRQDDARARADWADQALPAQALPHRADQPPG